MQNETTTPTDFSQLAWIIPVIINCILLLSSLWILFSMVHFGVATNKWKKNQKIDAEKLNSGWVYIIAVLCAAFSVIRFATSQVSFHIDLRFESSLICRAISYLLFAEYCHFSLFMFLFLWIRQKIFYANKMLQVNYGRFLHFFSCFSIFIIFVAYFSAILVDLFPIFFRPAQNNCHNADYFEVHLKITSSISTAILMIVELMLTALLVYPLYIELKKHKTSCKQIFCCFSTPNNEVPFTAAKSNSINLSPTSETSSSSFNIAIESFRKWSLPRQVVNKQSCKGKCTKATLKRSARMIKTVMTRTLLFGVVSVLLDICLIVVVFTPLLSYFEMSSKNVTNVIYDVNVGLKLMFVTFSFVNYKNILSSPCLPCYIK